MVEYLGMGSHMTTKNKTICVVMLELPYSDFGCSLEQMICWPKPLFVFAERRQKVLIICLAGVFSSEW